ncbi:threonine/serine exporter family protein [Lentilactobacillus laojiaonis]|uniref:threonine/serine exporter family protein n=1 Tax=Lentilactobacillus laojiaonis TaxID=2883998 RepID=UPI001D0AF259|nr:threonine/serine exporter family protein [Lentilactobacillus laojiaonis]UDM32343.1 threonine/serine exporter family protein [Lentilactobacillus laojiaonis]
MDQQFTDDYKNMVMKTCLSAARIMIESGADMDRVNDTVNHIACNAGFYESQSYITITGIVLSISSDFGARVSIIKKRSFDLEKVTLVNELSREFGEKKIDLQLFYDRLKAIDKYIMVFPLWVQLIGAALVSGPLALVFQNNVHDFLITCLVGMLGWAVFYFLSKYVQIRFLSEFIAALVIGVCAILSVRLGIGLNSDDIIIGSLMPLVPGVPLTNSVRDILYGNLVSGQARALEALISATALGFGIAVVLKLL